MNPRVAAASPGDPRGSAPLAPFEDALRRHFPARETLLAQARAQTRRRRVRPATVAALTAVLVAGLWWLDPAWRSEAIHTAIGEQSRWTMADGSTLMLNTGSSLRIETRLRSRRFVLDEGEAAFQVAHGWRPFIVSAGAVSVRDIGTVFNIRRQPGGVEVTVLEGAVEVSEPGRAPRTLTMGQAVAATDAGTAQPIRRVDTGAVSDWQRRRIVFDGMPLSAALAEIQRYREAPIVLTDARAGRLRLSGAFDAGAIEALIDTLPQALPVKVSRAADGSVRIGATEKSCNNTSPSPHLFTRPSAKPWRSPMSGPAGKKTEGNPCPNHPPRVATVSA